jgi:4-aminobutyrate aminotransferase-like enzyme
VTYLRKLTRQHPKITAAQDIKISLPYDQHLIHYGRDFLGELIVRAKGSYLYTEDGRAILDFSSGQMCATIGHSHPEILKAIRKAGETVIRLDSTMLSPDVVALANRLCELLPDELSKVQLLNTGGEANEAALRLAPPLTISKAEIDQALEIMDQALKETPSA